jgi:hypothetical protein
MTAHTHNDWGTRTVRRNPQVVSSGLGEAGVLVHLQTNRIYELNATGFRIWELAGEGCALADIAGALEREFDGDPDLIHGELVSLVDQLTREGLLETRQDGTA